MRWVKYQEVVPPWWKSASLPNLTDVASIIGGTSDLGRQCENKSANEVRQPGTLIAVDRLAVPWMSGVHLVETNGRIFATPAGNVTIGHKPIPATMIYSAHRGRSRE